MKAVIRLFLLIPILAVFGMAIPAPAHGEEISVFGPQIFSKVRGKPRTETVQFNVPVDIAGTLIILNGGRENAPKKKRVKKGKVVLNGVKIIPQKIDHDKDKDKDKDKDRDRRHKRHKHKHKKIKLNKKTGKLVLPVVLKAGSNSFSVKLKGKRGSKISVEFIIDDEAPTAAFTANPIEGSSSLNVNFDASGSTDPDDSIASYNWNFGEPGAPAGSGVTSSHQYNTPGIFTVTLTVTDQFGLTDQATTSITVTNPNLPPVAAFTATPSEGAAPLDVGFDGSGSTDPDDGIASYNWTFGDGGAAASGVNASHVYATPGNFIVTLTVTDTFGLTDQTTTSITVINLPPIAVFTATPSEGEAPLDVSFDASGSSDPNDSIASYDWDFGEPGAPAGSGVTTSYQYTTSGTFIATLLVTDTFGFISQTTQTVIVSDPVPPFIGIIPDAPSLANTLIADMSQSTTFLYTGPNAVQTGVTPGTIEPKRAAVARGRVFTRDGNPLPGVTVTVLNHPEFGQTLTRADGFYDMAVNGGGRLTLDFQKSGYLPGQRKVEVPWQDYSIADEIALIPVDTQMTSINLATATEPTFAMSSPVTDSDGTRQAAVMFPVGTTAEMVMPDGSTQPLTNLTVRATEFTVGSGGQMAMPAPLPLNTGYTYAVEFSIDEALAAGADTVNFSQPIPAYVDNFLSFPTGTDVPSAYYDRKKAAWVPTDNGRVIEILSITSGFADLDVDGSGTAANVTLLASLGISDAERQTLASQYGTGSSLWRVPVKHFSTFDWNFPIGFPSDYIFPEQIMASPKLPPDNCTICKGSIIQVEGQILGETIPITGTPFDLNYTSDRLEGYVADKLIIPLMGTQIPASLKRIDLTIDAMGRRFQATYTPQANLTHEFQWDGFDIYGREIMGTTNVKVKIDYAYQAVYQGVKTFGGVTTGVDFGPGRSEIFSVQEYETSVIRLDHRRQGLGGWTLDVNHFYDSQGRILYRGDGNRRSSESINKVITTIAGGGTGNLSGAYYGTATNLNFYRPGVRMGQAETDAEGNFYTMGRQCGAFCNYFIFKIARDGSFEVVAGDVTLTLPYRRPFEGQSARQMRPRRGIKLEKVDNEGNIYFVSDSGSSCCGQVLFQIDTNGIIHHIAGNLGAGGNSADGVPATTAYTKRIRDVDLDSEGNIYIVEEVLGVVRIRKIDQNGIITSLGGGNGNGSGFPAYEEGGLASTGRLLISGNNVSAIAIDSEDNIFYSSVSEPYIRKIGKDGRIRTIAGNGTTAMEEGALAIETGLEGVSAHSLAVDVEGNLYYGSRDIGIIWKIGKDGILRRIAGTGVALSGFNGDNIAAASANINIDSLVVAPDGAIYVADALHGRGRVIGLPLPGFSDTERVVPSEDGSEIYVFDSSGKHLRTQNTLTGTVVHDFTYDLAGRLITVVDGNGNSTSIQRDVSGNPTSITGPDGQVTLFFLNANGYLSDVTNPNNESYSMVYTAKGLITQFTNPRNNTSTFTYNAEGRMLTDTDAAGGSQTLARMETDDSYTVTNTSGLGRVSSFSVETLATGGKNLRTVTGPSGFSTVTLLGLDNSQTITSPDGTVTNITKNPDPRFGMLAPLSNLAVTTPGGIVSTLTTTRSVTLADPADPLSLTAMVDMLILNGRPFASVYDAALLKFTDTTPEGRVTTSFTDTQGRIIQEQVPGLSDTDFFYDVRGRLTNVRQGAAGPNQRLSSIAYDGNGFVASVTDPLNRAVQFEYDLAGRVTKQILPDLKEINFVYDTNGNVVSITPPGRPAHVFQYNKTDLETEYNPPDVGLPEDRTLFTYNLDKQLTAITRPDGALITFAYDIGGRLQTTTIPRGDVTNTYDPVTGNLTGITAPDGEALAFTYDGSLLLSSSWLGTVNGTLSRVYDNDFRITSRSVNGGNTINFGYDNDSLLTLAGSQSLTYDVENGLLTGTALGVVSDSYGYKDLNSPAGAPRNGFAEVSSYNTDVNASSVYQTMFVRDKLGRISQKTETVQGVTHIFDYSYDVAGRLTGVDRDSINIATYTYDTNGNRLNDGAVYDDQDRLTSRGTISYTYNSNGELVSKTDASGTSTYNYDVLGNLLSVDVAGGSLIEYIVDASNRRIGRKVDGTLDKGWLYKDSLNPIAELDGAGIVVSRFVYASKFNVPDFMIKGGNTYRIISDHLGSPRLVVDVATGLPAQTIDYDVWGNVIADTNPGFQPFGFAGGLYDSSSKLTRFGARDYDPDIGRWTSKDPIGFDSGGTNHYGYADSVGKPTLETNLYGYTSNDPINFVDPSGNAGISAGLKKIVSPLFQPSGAGEFSGKIAGGIGGALIGARINPVAAIVLGIAGATVGAKLGKLLDHPLAGQLGETQEELNALRERNGGNAVVPQVSPGQGGQFSCK